MQKGKESSSPLLADGPWPSHLIGVALFVLLALLPKWGQGYLDSKRCSPKGVRCLSTLSLSSSKAVEEMLLSEKIFSLESMLILILEMLGLDEGMFLFQPM